MMSHLKKDFDLSEAYSGKKLPIGSYGLLLLTFSAAVGGAAWILKRSGTKLPERIPAPDLLLLGVATHKLTRLIALDEVTSTLRAPFTRFEENVGEGEVSDEPRGENMQKAVGQLISCPYCLGVWVASGLAVTYAVSPRLARFVSSICGMVSISDFLHRAYYAAKRLG